MSSMLNIGDVVPASTVAQTRDYNVQFPLAWFLLRVHPLREFKVSRSFEQRGIWHYLPTYRKSVSINSIYSNAVRKTMKDEPIFPGLLFIPDFQAVERRNLLSVEGTSQFLTMTMAGDQKGFAFIGRDLFATIKDIEAVLAKPPSKRTAGDFVRINSGPFAGWIGRFERLDGNGRLRVLLQATEREMPLTIDEHQVEPV